MPLAVYVATLHPSVAGGDSGELITVARVLGVAHPPGYPLHTVLARLAALLPVGTFAWRVNALSAVCDAAAAVLLFRATRLWSSSRAAAVLAAGVFAFSPLVWSYATTAEVFALNNLFVAGLLALSARALLERERDGAARTATLHAAAFWLGLGFANHHTLVFYGVPFGVFVLLLAGRRAASPRFMLGLAAAHAAGFVPYVYLPLAAATRPPVTWGDAATVHGFVTHFLRREYGTFSLAQASVGEGGTLWPRLALFGAAATRGVLVATVPLLAASLLALGRRGHARLLLALWSVALVFYLVVFCTLANLRLDDPLHVFMQERFWQQGVVVLAALTGVGLAEATRRLGRAGAWARGAVALALPLALLLVHGRAAAADANGIVRGYGVAILDSLPPRAILVVSSDEAINAVRYLQEVEGRRHDVRVLPVGVLAFPWFRPVVARHMPDVRLPEAPFTFRALLDANAGRPIFVCNRVPWMQSLEDGYALWPAGLVEQVLPKGRPPELAALVAAAEASFARLDPAPALAFPAGSWEHGIGVAYWTAYERLGVAVARLASARPDDAAAHEASVRVFETLARRDPAPPPVVWKNLGVAYHRLSLTRPEAVAPMVRAWRRYLEIAPRTDPDLANIRLLVDDGARRLAQSPPTR